jgi:predicted secreted protein
MTIVGGIVTFIIIWWLVVFMVLPWRAQPSENPQPGNVPSAPDNPRIGLKALITTGITIVIFAIAWAIGETGWIDFHKLSR